MPPPPAPPSSCKKRNPFPLPYSLSASPLSTPPLSQPDPISAIPSSTSGPPNPVQQDREVWGSIENLLRAQKDAFQAQTARLAECSASITAKLDSIQATHDHSARQGKEESSTIAQSLEELKEMVRRKREEGYRFPRYVDFEKVLSMGWMSEEIRLQVIEPLRSASGLSDHHGSGVGRGRTSTEETRVDTPQLRLDELIDMSQFEEYGGTVHDMSGLEGGWSSGTDSGQANVPFNGLAIDQEVCLNTGTLVKAPRMVTDSPNTGRNPAPAFQAGSSSTIKKMRLPPYRPTIQPKASSSAAPHQPKHRRIESPPPSCRHSRAGSNMTDILAGINSYLVRPNRKRPVPDSESPEPTPPPPPQPAGRLRRRTKHPIYSTKWHPMDRTRRSLRLEDEARAAAEAADESSIRGLSTAPVDILPKSDGKEKKGGKKWRKWGENTLIGRMQTISCDVCQGRVHWACAGLNDHDDMTEDTWRCPDCDYILSQSLNGTPQPVPPAQQERCIRPECIVGTKRYLTKKAGDEFRHYAERIIGRRIDSRRVNGSKRYEYLTKWEGWQVYESTWQGPKSFDGGVDRLEAEFLTQCVKEGLNSSAKVVLLQETEVFWDEYGDLKRDMLEDLGIPEALWWPDPRGPWKIKVA